jgi:uncharacterized protein (DUF1800 family)
MPPSTPVSRADAAHFLRRIGFGGSLSEIDALVGQTRQAVVTAALDFSTAPAVVRPAVDDRSSQWQSYINGYQWWAERMVATSKPLQEKLTLFWHGHFCSAMEKVNDMGAMFDQNQLFRTHALGDFHDLCQAVAIDPAMLVYLDNATNRVGAEQENFARELMELFTMGVGNYSESDVIAMAKAWTGHNSVGWNGSFYDASYVFVGARHDNSSKTLFGLTQNRNGPAAITEIVRGSKQQACARFIAKKLFKFFAHTNPSDAVVQALASSFIASSMSIATLVEQILLHDEFWSSASRYQRVKSPVEFVVSTLRRIPVPVADSGITWSMESMGQVLFNPPNVAGWGHNEYWLSTATAWGRGSWLGGLRWHLDDINWWGTLKDLSAGGATQKILDDLGIVDASTATRNALQSWFNLTKPQNSWAIQPNALVVAGLTPEFQLA